MKKRIYDDDDGRPIADMSGISRRNIIGINIPANSDIPKQNIAESNNKKPEWVSTAVNNKERRSYIMGALGAGLLIALAFIVGIGLAILIIILISKL